MNEGWYVVELMGHATHVGYLREVEAFGTKLGQVDALQRDGTVVTISFGGSSIYRLTPITEEMAHERMKPYEVYSLGTRSPESDDFDEDNNEGGYSSTCGCPDCSCQVPMESRAVCGACQAGNHWA